MNILIINCSPVRNGATAEIVNLVKEHVEEGNVVKSVCIDDYDIKLCKGCRKCHETAKCFQEDDVDKLMVTYDWADKIVSVGQIFLDSLRYLLIDVHLGVIHINHMQK